VSGSDPKKTTQIRNDLTPNGLLIPFDLKHAARVVASLDMGNGGRVK
jgi:hypothetical protein